MHNTKLFIQSEISRRRRKHKQRANKNTGEQPRPVIRGHEAQRANSHHFPIQVFISCQREQAVHCIPNRRNERRQFAHRVRAAAKQKPRQISTQVFRR